MSYFVCFPDKYCKNLRSFQSHDFVTNSFTMLNFIIFNLSLTKTKKLITRFYFAHKAPKIQEHSEASPLTPTRAHPGPSEGLLAAPDPLSLKIFHVPASLDPPLIQVLCNVFGRKPVKQEECSYLFIDHSSAARHLPKINNILAL